MNQFLKSFRFVICKDHSLYGSINIYSSLQNPRYQIAIISKYLDNINFKEQIIKSFRQKLHHPNLIKILYCSFEKTNNICSEIILVKLAIEYHSQTLENLIGNYKYYQAHLKISFQEQEIWQLIGNTTEGLDYLESKGMEFNHLHPSNIVMSKDREFILVDSCLQQFPSLAQMQLGLRDAEYVAPEQLKQGVEVAQEKANIHCLGQICISCMCQMENKRFRRNQKYDQFLAFERLSREKKYSSELRKIVVQMVSNDPGERVVMGYQEEGVQTEKEEKPVSFIREGKRIDENLQVSRSFRSRNLEIEKKVREIKEKIRKKEYLEDYGEMHQQTGNFRSLEQQMNSYYPDYSILDGEIRKALLKSMAISYKCQEFVETNDSELRSFQNISQNEPSFSLAKAHSE